jgi:hypothetical protein
MKKEELELILHFNGTGLSQEEFKELRFMPRD